LNGNNLNQVTISNTNNITQLFSAYVDAFENFDIESALACYQIPCSLSMPDELKILQDKSELTNEFDDIFTQLKGLGFSRVIAHQASYQAINSDLILAIVHWQFFDQQGQMFTDFTALYHLIRDEESLRITNVISHQATEYTSLSHNLEITREK